LGELPQPPVEGAFLSFAIVERLLWVFLFLQNLFNFRGGVMFIGHHITRQQGEYLATGMATKPLHEVPNFFSPFNDMSFTLAVFMKVATARTFGRDREI